MIDDDPSTGRTGLGETAFIPYHRVWGGASFIVMIDSNAGNSNHEFMEVKHNGIPTSSGADESSSSTDDAVTGGTGGVSFDVALTTDGATVGLDGASVPTFGGPSITIDAATPAIIDPDGGSNPIVVTDVQAINGVIHAVSRVIRDL